MWSFTLCNRPTFGPCERPCKRRCSIWGSAPRACAHCPLYQPTQTAQRIDLLIPPNLPTSPKPHQKAFCDPSAGLDDRCTIFALHARPIRYRGAGGDSQIAQRCSFQHGSTLAGSPSAGVPRGALPPSTSPSGHTHGCIAHLPSMPAHWVPRRAALFLNSGGWVVTLVSGFTVGSEDFSRCSPLLKIRWSGGRVVTLVSGFPGSEDFSRCSPLLKIRWSGGRVWSLW